MHFGNLDKLGLILYDSNLHRLSVSRKHSVTIPSRTGFIEKAFTTVRQFLVNMSGIL